MSIIPRELRAIPDPPPVTFILSSRKRRKDGFERRDTYADFATAREFADELATHHKHYEAVVVNSKGVQVYSSRTDRGKTIR